MISPNQRIRPHKPSPSLPPKQAKTPTHHTSRSPSTDTTDTSCTTAPLIYSFDAPGLVEKNHCISTQSTEQASIATQPVNRDLCARSTPCRRLCALLFRKIKEHHTSVNAAFHLQYGSVAIDGRDSCGYGRKDGEVGGFRNSLKKHHREIDGAYGSYDGAVAGRMGVRGKGVRRMA